MGQNLYEKMGEEKMKQSLKKVLQLGTAALAVVTLAACGNGNKKESAKADKKITIGATSTPHAEILEHIKGDLKKDGYTLDVKVFDDYVRPNDALDNGDLDATYHQHQPYLDNYNKEKGTDLVSAGKVHFEPLGLYPGKTKSVDAVKDGADIAIPNDATNEARALLLLEQAGLIKLKKGAGINATPKDVTDNPKKLKFTELDASQIARSAKDVDLAVINANYAIEAGFDVKKDALEIEDKNSEAAQTYANIVAVKKGHTKDKKIKALMKALHSDDAKKFIEDKYKGAVVPLF